MAGADARVQDPLALAEIELYGELVIAATQSDGPLERERIDELLGLRGGQSGQKNR